LFFFSIPERKPKIIPKIPGYDLRQINKPADHEKIHSKHSHELTAEAANVEIMSAKHPEQYAKNERRAFSFR
jgi:hypothetical protein